MTINKLIKNIDTIDTVGKINEIIDEVNSGVSITVDSEMSSSSENPVQNKVIYSSLQGKQDILTAGENITISGGTISATDTTYEAGNGISIENGTISNTQTSAEWGNITGTLSDQADLDTVLESKQDTLVAGNGITIDNHNVISAVGVNGSFIMTCPTLTPVDGLCTWEIVHDLGTQSIVVSLYSSNHEVDKDVTINSNNQITVQFKASSEVTAGSYKVVILASGSISTIEYLEDDNQWVGCSNTIVAGASATDVDYDLSSYLPDDEYNYEILLYGQSIVSVKNGYRNLCVTSSLLSADTSICAIRKESDSNASANSSTIVVPIGTDRKLTVVNRPNDTGTYNLWLRGYRRITNTTLLLNTSSMATKDLSNITDTGKVSIAGVSIPSHTYIDLTLGTSGSEYTAPADGWYNVNVGSSNKLCYINMINRTSNFSVESANSVRQNWLRVMLPVLKGDKITIGYDTDTVYAFRFYYAKGSESEAN